MKLSRRSRTQRSSRYSGLAQRSTNASKVILLFFTSLHLLLLPLVPPPSFTITFSTSPPPPLFAHPLAFCTSAHPSATRARKLTPPALFLACGGVLKVEWSRPLVSPQLQSLQGPPQCARSPGNRPCLHLSCEGPVHDTHLPFIVLIIHVTATFPFSPLLPSPLLLLPPTPVGVIPIITVNNSLLITVWVHTMRQI